MGPAAHQPGGQVLQLGQLHFQLAFVRTCALGEDVQDQAGAIDHADTQVFFQVAFLHRGQHVVDQHQIRLQRTRRLGHLVRLAGADVVARVGILDAGADHAKHVGPGRLHQFGEFLGTTRGIAVAAGVRQDQDGAIAFLLSIEH